MKLINKTSYRTDDIRALVVAAHQAMGADMMKTVEVNQGRSRHHGRASYTGGWMMISLPPPGKGDIKIVAQVLEHEIAHNLGIRHEDMDEDVRSCRQEVPWLRPELLLRAKEEKPALTLSDRVRQREEKARRMLDRWDRKVKLAKTIRAKWAAKVSYYERKAAAGAEPKS